MSTENLQPQPPATTPRSRALLGWSLAGLIIVVVAVAVWKSHSAPGIATVSSPELVTVPVAPVIRADLYNQVTIPAEFRPYAEVDLHAKVSGYVREMKVDFGDKVKSGNYSPHWRCRNWMMNCKARLPRYAERRPTIRMPI